MIHHELGYTYVNTGDGPEGVEMCNPRDLLMGEEAGLRTSESMAVRVEAVASAREWILEAGPHPDSVAERLVVASKHYQSGLVHAMPVAHVLAVTTQDAVKREQALMRLLLEEPSARVDQTRRHGEIIKGALAKAYRREGHTYSAALEPSGLDRLRLVNVSAEEDELRTATLQRWFRYIWHGRSSLVDALKHFYTNTRGFAPELLLNMTGEELAIFFGQGRAAQCEREKLHINKRLERAGVKHIKLRFQKSAAACAKYADRAKGNHHRADSVKVA